MKLVQQDLDAYKAQQDRAKESREDYKKWQEKVKYGEEGSRVPKFYPVK